jgi:hypothetical protein
MTRITAAQVRLVSHAFTNAAVCALNDEYSSFKEARE